jgi:hypothetical protein
MQLDLTAPAARSSSGRRRRDPRALNLLIEAIEADRYPMSPRIRLLQVFLA